MNKAQASTENNNQIRIFPWEKVIPLTQEEAEARLHFEGFECFCWYDVPGTSYPKHRHEYDECIWILKGDIEFFVQDHIYHLKGGDRIYLPAQTSHITLVSKSTGATYLVGRKNTGQLQR